MFEEYQSEVLRLYQQKKIEGVLLNNILHPTPGNLKKECIGVFDRRYLRKDEIAISSFFEPQADEEAYRVAIRKFDRDKFKPLITVLKNGEGMTDRKNIELLAWLIDFEPRPYSFWLKKHNSRSVVASPEIDNPKPIQVAPDAIRNAIGESEKGNGLTTPVSHRTALVVIAMVILTFLAVGATYLLWPKSTSDKVRPKALFTVSRKCMYWAGTNYVASPCNIVQGDTPVVELDTFKLIHFKKILNWSILSKSSIKKVWYTKVNGTVEFYTSPGMHPVDTGKRLLPLTEYILNKHVLHNR